MPQSPWGRRQILTYCTYALVMYCPVAPALGCSIWCRRRHCRTAGPCRPVPPPPPSPNQLQRTCGPGRQPSAPVWLAGHQSQHPAGRHPHPHPRPRPRPLRHPAGSDVELVHQGQDGCRFGCAGHPRSSWAPSAVRHVGFIPAMTPCELPRVLKITFQIRPQCRSAIAPTTGGHRSERTARPSPCVDSPPVGSAGRRGYRRADAGLGRSRERRFDTASRVRSSTTKATATAARTSPVTRGSKNDPSTG